MYEAICPRLQREPLHLAERLQHRLGGLLRVPEDPVARPSLLFLVPGSAHRAAHGLGGHGERARRQGAETHEASEPGGRRGVGAARSGRVSERGLEHLGAVARASPSTLSPCRGSACPSRVPASFGVRTPSGGDDMRALWKDGPRVTRRTRIAVRSRAMMRPLPTPNSVLGSFTSLVFLVSLVPLALRPATRVTSRARHGRRDRPAASRGPHRTRSAHRARSAHAAPRCAHSASPRGYGDTRRARWRGRRARLASVSDPERVPHRAAQRISDSERLPNHGPERISHRAPEQLPDGAPAASLFRAAFRPRSPRRSLRELEVNTRARVALRWHCFLRPVARAATGGAPIRSGSAGMAVAKGTRAPRRAHPLRRRAA